MMLPVDIIQTLVMLWVFTWLGILLMCLRLFMRRLRGATLNLSDKITIVCIFCLIARLPLMHVALIWGTNKLPESFRAVHVFSATEIHQREIGSKLLLLSRAFYNTYLWLQKCVVMLLYQHILSGLRRTEVAMKAYWVIFAVTYIAVQVATFTDCQPFYLYFQVTPDPGTCSQAIRQLIVLGSLNIFTDILLIILPMPTLLRIKWSIGAKLRLMALFSLGIFLVATTVIRLPFNIEGAGMQVNRSAWASVESFVAAIVANVPTLYTLRKKLPEGSTNLARLSGGRMAGWIEPAKKRTGETSSVASTSQLEGRRSLQFVPSKKSVEVQERRKAMFIPPLPGKEDERPEGWDRRARLRDGKMEYMDDLEWEMEREKDRVSMDSFTIFGRKM